MQLINTSKMGELRQPENLLKANIIQEYPIPPRGSLSYRAEPRQLSESIERIHGSVVTEAALLYGRKLGKDFVNYKLGKLTLLRHYFDVDTDYVANKVKLVLAPFHHNDWTRKYFDSTPASPRYDFNSPDLYIPLMAFVTYLFVVGLSLGVRDQFSIETLAIVASRSIVCFVLEIIIQIATIYFMNINTALNSVELVAFAGYKYIGVVVTVLLNLIARSIYYIGLLYCSAAAVFFIVRSLRLQILTITDGFMSPPQVLQRTISQSVLITKRQRYFLTFIALSQPFFIWWLSSSFA